MIGDRLTASNTDNLKRAENNWLQAIRFGSRQGAGAGFPNYKIMDFRPITGPTEFAADETSTMKLLREEFRRFNFGLLNVIWHTRDSLRNSGWKCQYFASYGTSSSSIAFFLNSLSFIICLRVVLKSCIIMQARSLGWSANS
eukprot:Gregarina_sp_Poly_1__452@NODE_1109_length_5064_cov_23_687813_g640_i1_p2_GENE_NODE_1109_length_5064_cov_23_687813_g640_i1NODE_1109_length_5064_cov_23_687813_g640_i1_p2_ORF_typecomplete_len142_score20_14_NODE_1109_length_5064_cov_23_687813_g640_i123002725